MIQEAPIFRILWYSKNPKNSDTHKICCNHPKNLNNVVGLNFISFENMLTINRW